MIGRPFFRSTSEEEKTSGECQGASEGKTNRRFRQRTDQPQAETEITEMNVFRKNSVSSVCSCEEVLSDDGGESRDVNSDQSSVIRMPGARCQKTFAIRNRNLKQVSGVGFQVSDLVL
jgi:hypothetical protein